MRWGAFVVGAALGGAVAGAALAAEPVSGLNPAVAGAAPAGRPSGGIVVRGTDRHVGGEAPAGAPLPGGMVNLNLVEVPLSEAAKAVLADTLGWGYSLDERAAGTITLQTGGPVTRDTLLSMFETALGSRGLVLRRRGRTAQIVPSGGPGVQPVRGPSAESGAVTVPLRWISAAEMQAVLGAIAPREVVLRADRTRNLLILSGDAGQIRALRQTIEVFDVDWMRGMSTAMLPVRSANPRSIARDLAQIFGGEAAGTGDMIRFVPNEALGAILVVSSRAAYLDRARGWLEQLETFAAERERQLFVYRIQNRSAKELAMVLQGVVAAETGMSVGGGMGGGMGGGLSGGLGGGLSGGYGGTMGSDPSGLGSGGGFGSDPSHGGSGSLPSQNSGGFGSSFGGASGAQGAGSGSGLGGGTSGGSGGTLGGGFGAGAGGLSGAPGTLYGGASASGYGMDSGYGGYGGGMGTRRDAIGIVADEANNSLVISATRNQYDKILRILGRLDAMPTQVLLETVIAEVTLNDSLRFGVQWFLKNGGGQFNNVQGDVVGSSGRGGGTASLVKAAVGGVPGFNYLLNASDFNVVLNALQGVTRVNVISSPNITVLDNRTAKLQVGDQVPIVQQTGQSALSTNAPILNQIEMKDTGVILSVTPRVNKNGLVVLDINQEVSDVVKTTTSNINSPTIRQRRVATSVAVNDGHSLAIGGMVQEKAQISNEAVPVLGELPVIGQAFRNRIDERVRTELIVFIRPRVIRGTAEADRIAEDFRQQFKAMMPVRPVPAPPPMAVSLPGQEGVLRRMME
jgi:general secretion pathway protein D